MPCICYQWQGWLSPKIWQSSIWVDGTITSSTKCLMFQVLSFFNNFLQTSLQKSFQFFFYNFKKIKIKSFECPKSIRNYKKNDAWNITLGPQVICPSEPANQRCKRTFILTSFDICNLIFETPYFLKVCPNCVDSLPESHI